MKPSPDQINVVLPSSPFAHAISSTCLSIRQPAPRPSVLSLPLFHLTFWDDNASKERQDVGSDSLEILGRKLIEDYPTGTELGRSWLG
jgi:hypothetical protein